MCVVSLTQRALVVAAIGEVWVVLNFSVLTEVYPEGVAYYSTRIREVRVKTSFCSSSHVRLLHPSPEDGSRRRRPTCGQAVKNERPCQARRQCEDTVLARQRTRTSRTRCEPVLYSIDRLEPKTGPTTTTGEFRERESFRPINKKQTPSAEHGAARPATHVYNKAI